MSIANTPWGGARSLAELEPDKPIKFASSEVHSMKLDPTITRGEHAITTDHAGLQATRPSTQDLVTALTAPAVHALEAVVNRQWAALEGHRDRVFRQLTFDAYRKTGQNTSLMQFHNAVPTMSRRLVTSSLRDVRQLDVDAALLPSQLLEQDERGSVPNDIVAAVVAGLGRCVGVIEARNRVNLCAVAGLVDAAVATLRAQLVQVAMYQCGGADDFARFLAANGNSVVLYDTAAVRAVVARAEAAVRRRVEEKAREIVAVTMHVGDFRIW